jgi:hypothetical protein
METSRVAEFRRVGAVILLAACTLMAAAHSGGARAAGADQDAGSAAPASVLPSAWSTGRPLVQLRNSMVVWSTGRLASGVGTRTAKDPGPLNDFTTVARHGQKVLACGLVEARIDSKLGLSGAVGCRMFDDTGAQRDTQSTRRRHFSTVTGLLVEGDSALVLAHGAGPVLIRFDLETGRITDQATLPPESRRATAILHRGGAQVHVTSLAQSGDRLLASSRRVDIGSRLGLRPPRVIDTGLPALPLIAKIGHATSLDGARTDVLLARAGGVSSLHRLSVRDGWANLTPLADDLQLGELGPDSARLAVGVDRTVLTWSTGRPVGGILVFNAAGRASPAPTLPPAPTCLQHPDGVQRSIPHADGEVRMDVTGSCRGLVEVP